MAPPPLGALRDYASMEHPAKLGMQTLLLETPQCIAIFDKFAKARYHFLVLPRTVDGAWAEDVTESDLDSLSTLLRHPARKSILEAMRVVAAEVVEMVQDEMEKSDGWQWDVEVGFHSVPSMQHVHLHVISNDLISPALKNKKHYNSFRPDLGFFVPLRDVMGWVDKGDKEVEKQVAALRSKEELLKSPLTCFKCGETFNNIPKLKDHLEDEFAKESRKAKGGRR